MPAWGLRIAGATSALNRIVSKKTSLVGTTGASLEVVWEVDNGSSLNPGDSVSVLLETGPKGAPQDWKLVFYPRGFVDPAVTSFFVTNVGLQEGRTSTLDREISAAVSVAVLPTAEETGKKSLAKKPNKSSEGDNAIPSEVCRKLSKIFCSKSPTYGFENFVDRDVVCNRSSPFLHGSEGTLHLKICINVSAGAALNQPEVENEVRDSGWQRVKWVLQDFKSLIRNTPRDAKLSSPCFHLNGEWYFDLYPSGYRANEAHGGEFVSLYLHSSKRQSDRGHKIKRRLRLGLQRLNPLPQAVYSAAGQDAADVSWARGGDIVAIFSSDRRSAGCRGVVQHSTLSRGLDWDKSLLDTHRVSAKAVAGELVAGQFDKGGSVTFIMDLLVSDQVEGQVHQGLRLVKLARGAGHDIASTCHASKRSFALPPALGGAGKPACCHVCGYMFSADLLTVAPHTRLPQFGYEVGREVVMDAYFREAPASGAERIVRDLEQHLSKSAVWRSAVRIEVLLRTPLSGLKSLIPLGGAGGTGEEGLRRDSRSHGCEPAPGVVDHAPDEARLSGFAAAKCRAEAGRQDAFQRDLEALRSNLEDALFAKPVCSNCEEVCKQWRNAPSIVAHRCGDDLSSAPPADEGGGAGVGFARGWRQAQADFLRVLEGGEGPRRGRSVGCLARGGAWGDPFQLAGQCAGRVNRHAPLRADDDVALDSFCDVRFDRPQQGMLAFSAPRKVHCVATGKVFCPACAAYKLPLPQLSDDPASPHEFEVCREAYMESRQRSSATGGSSGGGTTILYVTQRQSSPHVRQARRVHMGPSSSSSPAGDRAAADEDEDEDEDEGLVGRFLRRYCLRPVDLYRSKQLEYA